MAKIGIFGGTFDPIHNGHFSIACEAKKRLSLDCVILVPAGDPPHKSKKKGTDKAHRLRLTELVFAGKEGFLVSDYEIQKDGPAYSVDLIRYFKECYPEDELFFVIGADSFRDLPTWWHYRELLEMVHFVVLSRPDTEKAELLSLFSGDEVPPRVFYFSDMAVDISSTQVRALAYRGEDIGALVPDVVLEYINEHQLYRD